MPNLRSVSCGLDVSEGDRATGAAPLSPSSAAALSTAERIARDEHASLHLLTALDLDAAAEWALERLTAAGGPTVASLAMEQLERIAAGPRAAGVVTTTEVSHAAPATALLADADRAGRDLIVVGTRERGALARNLLGSTALKLLRRAPQPVWVARTALGARPPVVLAAIDLGDMAPRVVANAARVATRTGGTLHVLHVVDLHAGDVLRAGAADESVVLEYRKRRRATAESEVPALVARAIAGLSLGAAAPSPKIHLPDGDAAATIVHTSDELRADVVVVGSVRHGFVSGLVTGLGRTAETVLQELRSSLLVLKPQPTPAKSPAK